MALRFSDSVIHGGLLDAVVLLSFCHKAGGINGRDFLACFVSSALSSQVSYMCVRTVQAATQ